MDSILSVRTRPPAPEAPAARPLPLPSGRAVACSVEDGLEQVSLLGPTGELEVRVTFTERGPVLHVRAVDLVLEARDEVAIRCGRLRVETAGDLEQHCGGALRQTVGGDAHLHVAGDLRTEADAVETHARLGDVRLKANDDVRLNGERIKLNT